MTTRFAVAVHILIFLHRQGGEPTPSKVLAASVNTDPSLIRRLLAKLNRAGLTSSQRGAGGGALLDRPAHEVTLLDVHEAVEDDWEVIPIHPSPHPQCPVGGNIEDVLTPRIEEVQQAVRAQLAQTTIADLADEVSKAAD